MKLYDVEQSAQEGLDQGPVFDTSDTGRKIKDREKKSKSKFVHKSDDVASVLD